MARAKNPRRNARVAALGRSVNSRTTNPASFRFPRRQYHVRTPCNAHIYDNFVNGAGFVALTYSHNHHGTRVRCEARDNYDMEVSAMTTSRGAMAAKLTPASPGARDSHWFATQCELRTARRRGDVVVLLGAAALLSTLAFYQDRIGEIGPWLILSTLLLAVISTATWIVAKGKRRIAIRRGMVCSHCEYRPHDTEIDEIALTHQCPHCAADL
jgi:hypothetical protein